MKNSLILLLSLLCIIAKAQPQYLQGFSEKVSGFDFTYHSPLPHVTSSLISRANKNFPPVVWETEIIPKDYKGKTVTFIWVYGMDVLPESEEFDFYINDKEVLTFRSPFDNDQTTWSVSGKNGEVLTFNRTMIDKHKDQMGFVTLTLPLSLVKKGEPLILKVDGADKGSNAWYMTYKTELKEELRIGRTK